MSAFVTTPIIGTIPRCRIHIKSLEIHAYCISSHYQLIRMTIKFYKEININNNIVSPKILLIE